MVGQGRLDEAEPWLERAGRTLRTEAEPATGMNLHYARWISPDQMACSSRS
jgi:hypothetical protein